MARRAVIPLAAAIGICAAVSPAYAHHSHGAFYDACIPVTVEGSVEAVQWKDPHVLIDLKTGEGVVYRAELPSPQGLSRKGIEANMVSAGERIVVTGAPLRPVDQLDPSVRSFYRDLNVKILDVLQIHDSGGRWSWGVEPAPNSENCARGFPFKK